MLDILELSEETVSPTSTRMTELLEALRFSEVSVLFVPVWIRFSGTLTADPVGQPVSRGATRPVLKVTARIDAF